MRTLLLALLLAAAPAWALVGADTAVVVQGGTVAIAPFEKFPLLTAGCSNATAASFFDLPTSLPGVAACYGTSPHRFGALDFADGASALTANTHFTIPSDWNSAVNPTVDFIWFWNGTGTGSTNQVAWTIKTVCVADTEVLTNPTYNAVQTTLDAAINTSMARNSAQQASLTMTGCAAGETLFLQVGRDPTNGSDTFAGTASLLEIVVTFQRNQ